MRPRRQSSTRNGSGPNRLLTAAALLSRVRPAGLVIATDGFMPFSLSLSPPDAIEFGNGFSLQEVDGKVYYFFNLALIDAHDADDTERRDWRVGFFVVVSGLNPHAVADAFGLSVQAVHRLAQQYRTGETERISRKPRPKGRIVAAAQGNGTAD